ncbi:hypothetical protein [Mesorhizobium sp. CAU 1741]|uniref:hypothetical protein n=1 Tax=Mesorhizobium sp. CAU 1741 TaxID=3140366 RepID=UPI00325B073F
MADTPNTDQNRRDLEKQIADLRADMAALTKTVSERGGAVYDDLSAGAEGMYTEASRQARGAAKQVRNQAYLVSEAARENPGTAATVLSSAGILGFLIGLAVGHALSANEQPSRRWY